MTRITEIRASTIGFTENRSNATMDFSEMTLGLCAVVTDVVKNGKPVVGYGYGALGRYSQESIWRERMIPRIMKADPEALLNEAGDNLDPRKILKVMIKNEKDGGHGDRAAAASGLDIAMWDAAAKIADKPTAQLFADAAGRDDGHGYSVRYSPRQFQIKANTCAITVHGCQQQFASAERYDAFRPFDHINARVFPPAMDENGPFPGGDLFRVNRDYDALRAEFPAGLSNKIRVGDGGGIDGDFVSTCQQQLAYVFHCTNSAADS